MHAEFICFFKGVFCNFPDGEGDDQGLQLFTPEKCPAFNTLHSIREQQLTEPGGEKCILPDFLDGHGQRQLLQGIDGGADANADLELS